MTSMMSELREPKRVFSSRKHSNLDKDGVQRYTLFEVIVSGDRRRYVQVADRLTEKQVREFIAANGVVDA